MPVDLSLERIQGSKDVRLLVIARPGSNLSLPPPEPPASAQGGVELHGDLVGKDNVQAFEMPGATHENFEGSFFLDRSRSSFPGSSCLGLRSRHPMRWSWRRTCSSLKRAFHVLRMQMASRLQSQLLKGYPRSLGPVRIHSTTASHCLGLKRDLRPGPLPTRKSPWNPAWLNRWMKEETDWRHRPILLAASWTGIPSETHCKAWSRSRSLRLDSTLSLASSALTGTRRLSSIDFDISRPSWEQLIIGDHNVKVH